MSKVISNEEKINLINLRIDDICTQLEHHSDYFYDKSIVLDDVYNLNKKLINEYFTYHRVMSNFIQELKEINCLINQTRGNFVITTPKN